MNVVQKGKEETKTTAASLKAAFAVAKNGRPSASGLRGICCFLNFGEGIGNH